MRIDYYHNKKSDITYVYRAESYYDPVKKRCGTRRVLIGKLDPESGQVVPTGKRGRPRKEPKTGVESCEGPASSTISDTGMSTEAGKQDEDLAMLHAELARLKIENIEMRRIIDSIVNAVSGYNAQ